MNDPIYVIGQLLGAVAIVLGFVTYQMKTQKGLIAVNTTICIVFSVHYLMIGALPAMAMNAIGAIRGVFYYFREKRGSKSPLLPIIFAVVMAIAGVITWSGWYSVFVFTGLVVNTLCLGFSDPQKVRMSILVTSPLVLIYNIFALSIGGMIFESVSVVSSVIGIIRANRIKNASHKGA